MADTKVLIIAKDQEAGQAYAKALSEIGAAYDIAPSFNEMVGLAVDNAYNGLLIDILTLVRSSGEDKVIAYECINLYPVLRVRWENKKKKISLSPLEQSFSPDTASVLKFFVEQRCTPFCARRLRKHNRKSYHLNVLLSLDSLFDERDTIKTFSLNISPGGIFIYTPQVLEKGRTVWLRFAEFPGLGSVQATVRWSIEWGHSRSIPGAGLEFDWQSESQAEALRNIAG